MAEEGTPGNAKPDGGVGNFMVPNQLVNMTTAEQSVLHNIMLRGKPFEDLASISTSMPMAGFNRPLVVITQENDGHQNEVDTPMGGASNDYELNSTQ